RIPPLLTLGVSRVLAGGVPLRRILCADSRSEKAGPARTSLSSDSESLSPGVHLVCALCDSLPLRLAVGDRSVDLARLPMELEPMELLPGVLLALTPGAAGLPLAAV